MKTSFDFEIKPFKYIEGEVNIDFQGGTLKTTVDFDKGEYPEVIKSVPALISGIKNLVIEINKEMRAEKAEDRDARREVEDLEEEILELKQKNHDLLMQNLKKD